jgi:FAD synthase
MEVHLLEPETLPEAGDTVRVALVEYIRPEKAFPSVDALREQIAVDVASARGRFDQDGLPFSKTF